MQIDSSKIIENILEEFESLISEYTKRKVPDPEQKIYNMYFKLKSENNVYLTKALDIFKERYSLK